jgi:GT2 family glycosyltransferase
MVNSIDIEATVYVINNTGVRQDFEHSNPLVKMHWVDMPSNLGVASSWNLGIKMLPFESKWIFTQTDCYFEPGVLEQLSKADNDALTLCGQAPYWHTFALGEKVLQTVGLFDENLHPAYFEDTDYERRSKELNIKFKYLDKTVFHDNSSTIKSDDRLMQRNAVTFQNNQSYYQYKMSNDVLSEGRWNLDTRRINSWD